jgi:hypothetical protein
MTVTISPSATSYEPGEMVHVTVTVANTGAGHYLPTYVTPKIFVEAHLLDAQGQSIPDSAQQATIGREVTLDLSQELYDTRIPPKASHAFTYTHVLSATAMTLRVRVVVHPDHFYRQFFAATLADGDGGQGRAYLQDALRAAEASPFTVFARDVSLRKPLQ